MRTGAIAPTRPALRWFGGKWKTAPWIASHFPEHDTYTEAFGGAASVLLQKPRSYAEVYNDLDGDVVNFFRVLRGPQAEDLVRAVALTPFSREEFYGAYEPTEDPLERARRMAVRSFMGFGSKSCKAVTGFRCGRHSGGSLSSSDWTTYPDALRAVIERLRGVLVERKDAADVLRYHDGPRTLHFVDPPYLLETRTSRHRYTCEMSADDHRALAGVLRSLRGGGSPQRLRTPALRRRALPRLAPRNRARLRVQGGREDRSPLDQRRRVAGVR